MFFFFNDTATTEIYTLSLHDALPIFSSCRRILHRSAPRAARTAISFIREAPRASIRLVTLVQAISNTRLTRSEEHTSELQSQSNLVCRLLLEKKKIMTLHLTTSVVDL